jgi:hypothetical protein
MAQQLALKVAVCGAAATALSIIAFLRRFRAAGPRLPGDVQLITVRLQPTTERLEEFAPLTVLLMPWSEQLTVQLLAALPEVLHAQLIGLDTECERPHALAGLRGALDS